ncbi:MAG: endonuclease/exonuclease/phosphatase family protein [Firmicutes bacterium]|nr:endonuclease/exonuclease/phosphatase family protein [Candidatus Colimorpha enterica]
MKLKVMSYNVLTGAKGERLEQIVKVIRDYDPDVIGFQEVQPMTLIGFQKLLCNDYDYLILARDNESFESTPLFYKKDKFNLIDGGSKWISDTPDKMSKYAVSAYTRVYTYAVLEDKETGVRFTHLNTHIDYIDEANTIQVYRLLELTEPLRNMPIFYTADWNMYRESDGYRVMQANGMLDVALHTIDSHYGPTFPSSEAYIDFIFASVNGIKPTKYRVINDHEFSATSSDHYPIYAELEIKN